MTRKVPMTRAVGKPVVAEQELIMDSRTDEIMARPDGYYWQAPDGKQEFGPFESIEEALADKGYSDDDEEPVPGETLQEAEDEIGIADWIDPETGQPAEGQSPPRLIE